MTAAELNRISGQVVDAAMEVHSVLGPGLLESSYQACLGHELSNRGLGVRTQLAVPLVYKSIRLEAGYRLDMLVENAVVVEIKAIEKVLPIHEAQLLCFEVEPQEGWSDHQFQHSASARRAQTLG